VNVLCIRLGFKEQDQMVSTRNDVTSGSTKDFKASTSALEITQVDTSKQKSTTKMHDQLFVAWNMKNCF